MKNKTLAIFGITMYVLSVLSSAENLEGQSTAPLFLIAISAIGNLVFLIIATVRIWKKARGLAITYLAATIISFILLTYQTLISAQDGSLIIVLSNIAKVVSFIALILVIIKLFKKTDLEQK